VPMHQIIESDTADFPLLSIYFNSLQQSHS
jgi:hypothetical protein